ncbi:type II toxin-antitoxin system VapC family toxin [Aliihoeflea sp. 2WW]|uniref:PIN domain-containing protein n=1 Tax=Aliihoeflea sp. 2WW TaxID=1381123 RepID=UPI0004648834|nr:type II toxin-antitoxin system VapC family toxin [Aliihoeflea sp. 2WW]
MIGVDTNVLLRLYVADDASQHATASRFFGERTAESPAYISMIVFVEFIWALTRTYNYGWDRVFALIGALISAQDILIEREDAVTEALARAVEEKIDLVDALIARANADDGCSSTVTFDRKAARRLSSMQLLTGTSRS